MEKAIELRYQLKLKAVQEEGIFRAGSKGRVSPGEAGEGRYSTAAERLVATGHSPHPPYTVYGNR